MPNVTKNYGLTKPFPEEFYDIAVHNQNMDIIDETLGKCASIAVTDEVPEDADFWIDPSEESIEEAHVYDRNNPHSVTYTQVGAAPAGYGLGNVFGETLNDTHAFTGVGWYIVAANSANMPTDMGGTDYTTIPALMFVRFFSHTYAEIDLWFPSWSESYTPYFRQKYVYGKWEDWCWVDPPMVLNEEYRTTERYHNGTKSKPVYAKAIQIGGLLNAARKQGSFCEEGVAQDILSCVAVCGGENQTTFCTPANLSSTTNRDADVIAVAFNNGKCEVVTFTDLTVYTSCVVTVKYTKIAD